VLHVPFQSRSCERFLATLFCLRLSALRGSYTKVMRRGPQRAHNCDAPEQTPNSSMKKNGSRPWSLALIALLAVTYVGPVSGGPAESGAEPPATAAEEEVNSKRPPDAPAPQPKAQQPAPGPAPAPKQPLTPSQAQPDAATSATPAQQAPPPAPLPPADPATAVTGESQASSHTSTCTDCEHLQSTTTATDWIQAMSAFAIVCLTLALVVTGARQEKSMANSVIEMKRSIDMTTREAMPLLYPRVEASGIHLHPEVMELKEQATHRPSLALFFQNVGRTPAMLHYVGARLYLTEQDKLPANPPPLLDIPCVQSDAVIPGGGIGGKRGWDFDHEVDIEQMRRLAQRATGDFLRFYLVGFVIYEDVFNNRHTRRFCLKVRQNFQAMRGGKRYNSMTTEVAPEREPEGLNTQGSL
jgi:outer membrane biosynthesis protein TonB